MKEKVCPDCGTVNDAHHSAQCIKNKLKQTIEALGFYPTAAEPWSNGTYTHKDEGYIFDFSKADCAQDLVKEIFAVASNAGFQNCQEQLRELLGL